MGDVRYQYRVVVDNGNEGFATGHHDDLKNAVIVAEQYPDNGTRIQQRILLSNDNGDGDVGPWHYLVAPGESPEEFESDFSFNYILSDGNRGNISGKLSDSNVRFIAKILEKVGNFF